MATRISVTVTGPLGLDDPDRMLDDLGTATDLRWQAHEGRDRSGTLISGYVELVLTAIVGKGVEMSVDAAVDAVREARKKWRERRLDPPEITIDTEDVPDTDSGADSGAADATEE